MSIKKKNRTGFLSSSGNKGGVQFAYLYVVQELYESFVKEYRIPRPGDQFWINAVSIPSGTDYVREAFERYEPPLIVEAPLISAANVLADDEEMYRLIGVTYLISPLSHKCGLYCNVPTPEKASPFGDRIQFLFHTGSESIATLMAETYIIKHDWKIDLEASSTGIPMTDYKTIYKYVEKLPSEKTPIRVAFVMSGKYHYLFLREQRDRFWGVEDLTRHFCDIVPETSNEYMALKSGIPGTVLLTRATDLASHGLLIQRFMDAWYEYLENIGEDERFKYLNQWRFMPVSWASPQHFRNAVLFTDFVLTRFGRKKLHKGRPLPIACCEPVLPNKLDNTQKIGALKAFLELHREFAGRSVERLVRIPVTDVERIQDFRRRAEKKLKQINEYKVSENAVDVKDIRRISGSHRELDWLVDNCAQKKQYELCNSCAGKCFYGKMDKNAKIVFQILIWQAMFARYFDDPEEAYINQQKLLASNLAEYYRELVEGLSLGDKEFLKKNVNTIRNALGDDASRQVMLQTRGHEDKSPADYGLTMFSNESMWSEFSCRIVDTFNSLMRAKKYLDDDHIERAESSFQQARKQAKKSNVLIPVGALIRLGLCQFVLPDNVK